MAGDWRRRIEVIVGRLARPAEKWSHQARLYPLCEAIGEDIDHDPDVLHAACWLHDIGVFEGAIPDDPAARADWDHVAFARERVPPLLKKCGFPAERIPAVITAIEDHLPECQPRTAEGIILRDADILEQLGAIAVLRTTCKIGRDTRFHTFSDAVASLHRARASLPAQLASDTARELAAPRIAALDAFLAAVDHEAPDPAHLGPAAAVDPSNP